MFIIKKGYSRDQNDPVQEFVPLDSVKTNFTNRFKNDFEFKRKQYFRDFKTQRPIKGETRITWNEKQFVVNLRHI